MGVALVGLVPFLRWLGVRRLADLGLRHNPAGWRDLVLGACVAVLGLGLFGLGLVAGGAFVLDPLASWTVLAGGARLPGLAVAAIEEPFFRGALLGRAGRELFGARALLVMALLFGILHFLRPDRASGPEVEVTWLSASPSCLRARPLRRAAARSASGMLTPHPVRSDLSAGRWCAPAASTSPWGCSRLVFGLRSFYRPSRPGRAEVSWLVGESPKVGACLPSACCCGSWRCWPGLLRHGRRGRPSLVVGPSRGQNP